MGKRKGSTRPITPLRTRNPKLFAKIKEEIANLGVDFILLHGTVSKPTIYRFLDGNESLTLYMEGELQGSIKAARVAQKAELQKVDETWKEVLTN